MFSKLLDKKMPGVLCAQVDGPAALTHAAETMRDAGYKDFDCHSPYPIHGMDQAMGISRSKVGYFACLFGAIGLSGALLLQWWTSAIDYPFVISGKPLFSLPAFIPVIFALTILFTAFGSLIGLIVFNKFPRPYHPLFNSERFEKFSDGGFFVSVETSDPKFDREKTARLLESAGGKNIEFLSDEE